MRYITSFGGLYRVSERNWRRWLHQCAAGGDEGITPYATMLGPVTDISDFTTFDADLELERLSTKAGKR